jgi:hypothetical protein
MMAPNALGAETLHEQQDHSAFHSYSPEHYSDSELDGGRGKGANGKPRTRLGYQRISIACRMFLQSRISDLKYTVADAKFDVYLQLGKATVVKTVIVSNVNASFNRSQDPRGREVVIKVMRSRQIQCHMPKHYQ